MNDERYRELLALRLYGELSPEDERELEDALTASESLRRFAAELESGLGSLAGATADAPQRDLPAGWRERLDAVTRSAPVRSTSRWAAAAGILIGFAAGAVFMWAVNRTPPPPRTVEPAVSAFERDTAPPPAQVQGRLARLGELYE